MADPPIDLLPIARAINDGLGESWAYANYGGDEWNSMREQLLSAAAGVVSLLTTLRPMSEARKIDGHEILAWEKSRWGSPPRWRVIHWSEGPHHVCYDKCWVCSVCTLSQDEDSFAGWLPMPHDPVKEETNAE